MPSPCPRTESTVYTVPTRPAAEPIKPIKLYGVPLSLMAGIYLHIPFCRQGCLYCNFHFSTSLNRKNDFIAALLKETGARRDYLEGEMVETVYFGGGTP